MTMDSKAFYCDTIRVSGRQCKDLAILFTHGGTCTSRRLNKSHFVMWQAQCEDVISSLVAE